MSETNETSLQKMQEMSVAFHATPEQVDLIKRTVCRGATDDELALFLYTAKRTGLDPLLKQIHAVKRFDSKLNHEVMAIQVGIDGYRLMAERTGKYLGSEEPIFEYFPQDQERKIPRKAAVAVLKLGPQGSTIKISASALWDEYYPGEKLGFMWRKIPHDMLAKVAESHALRKAFPAELSGIYTDDEMGQPQPSRPASKKANVLPVNSPKKIEAVCVEDGESYGSPKPSQDAVVKLISETQQQNIRALAKSAKMTDQELADLLGSVGYESVDQVAAKHFSHICKGIVEKHQAKVGK